MSAIDDILASFEGLQAAQEAFYKDLHQHPELSHPERRTAQCVAGELQKYGCTVLTGIGGTGVVGVLPSVPGPPSYCGPNWTRCPSARTPAWITPAS